MLENYQASACLTSHSIFEYKVPYLQNPLFYEVFAFASGPENEFGFS